MESVNSKLYANIPNKKDICDLHYILQIMMQKGPIDYIKAAEKHQIYVEKERLQMHFKPSLLPKTRQNILTFRFRKVLLSA